jgi:hypothetical protein
MQAAAWHTRFARFGPRAPEALACVAAYRLGRRGRGLLTESKGLCRKHLEFVFDKDISFYQLYGPWCLAMH